MGRGEKVLFVSAKMAALNVVYERLAERGLGRFCLEAHSTKAGKAKIIDELRRTLEAEARADDGPLSEQLDSLVRVRGRLNAYVQELHRRLEPLGLTVYQGIGKVAKSNEVPDIRAKLPWPEPLKVSRAEVEMRLDLLDELAGLADVFDRRVDHPWNGLEAPPGGAMQQESLESDLTTLAEAVRSTIQARAGLDPLIPKHRDLSVTEIESLASALDAVSQIEDLPDGWWERDAEQLRNKLQLFEAAARAASEFNARLAEYQKFFDIDFHGALELLRPVATRFARWHRRLLPSYWRWRSGVRQKLRIGAQTDFSALQRYGKLSQQLCDADRWFREHVEQLSGAVNPTDARDEGILRRAALRFRAAVLLQKGLTAVGIQAGQGCTVVSAETRAGARTLVSNLPSRSLQVAGAIRKVDALWTRGFVGGAQVCGVPLSPLVAKLDRLLAAMPRLREWVLLQRVLSKCRDQGLSPFVDSFGEVSARLARQAFEKRFYAMWTSAAIQASEILAEFRGTARTDLIDKFRSLDQQIRESQARHIQAVASAGAQMVGSAKGDFGNISEVGILRRELQKKKRIKPLRKLFAEIPNVLQALKPCMLMSPISVSTYLKPGTCRFDLVIFDEASQLPTAEAVPSILRANKVVVAGDSNQLPPTSFFEASIFDDSEDLEERPGVDAAPEPLESLLDDCKAIVPVFREAHLRWHYRSRDERLIKFSNHNFYDNRLITFPSASTDKTGRGVHFEYVPDGVWDRGRSRTNRGEALRVAGLIVQHFETYPHRSLGVVAMNRFQKEAIEDLLAEELHERPDLAALLNKSGNEAFFVKSLENVQGDERDTMIISIGYGKDADGHLTLNFGPLNMEGGWRRLNVLVTRAKWQTILVTSLRSTELTGINPQNRGALALKNFIEYAERDCDLPHQPSSPTQGETNDFEDAVREALVQMGLTVDAQVGASKFRIDLAVRDRRDPCRYALGIECDGAMYHSSRTARDRDLLRQQILRHKGWRIHRVWSTDWFHDREGAILSIFQSLEQAEATPPEELVEAPPLTLPSKAEEREAERPPAKNLPSRGQPPITRRYSTGQRYQKFRAESKWRNSDWLLRPANVAKLAELITEIVRVEGPIHEQLVMERLKEIYGIDRIPRDSSSAANIVRAIDLAVSDNRLQRGRHGHFLFRAGAKLTDFRLPDDGVDRSVDMIAPEEIELAILHVVEEQFGVQRDRLPHAAASVLGVRQLRADAATLIHEIVDDLVQRGLLRASGFQVYVKQTN